MDGNSNYIDWVKATAWTLTGNYCATEWEYIPGNGAVPDRPVVSAL